MYLAFRVAHPRARGKHGRCILIAEREIMMLPGPASAVHNSDRPEPKQLAGPTKEMRKLRFYDRLYGSMAV